ncbi:MAG: hypothetical protein R3C44_12380 [Chloroflexota bacterium]
MYAHYAGSYLYLLYLRQRVGESGVRELVRHPANGLAAIQSILDGFLPGTESGPVFGRLGRRHLPGPPEWAEYYGYDLVDLPQPALATRRARRLPFSTLNELDQFAVDYIDLDLSGPVRVTFVGDTTVPLVDEPPPSGSRFWYAAPGNSSEATLTTVVDLRMLLIPY